MILRALRPACSTLYLGQPRELILAMVPGEEDKVCLTFTLVISFLLGHRKLPGKSWFSILGHHRC